MQAALRRLRLIRNFRSVYFDACSVSPKELLIDSNKKTQIDARINDLSIVLHPERSRNDLEAEHRLSHQIWALQIAKTDGGLSGGLASPSAAWRALRRNL